MNLTFQCWLWDKFGFFFSVVFFQSQRNFSIDIFFYRRYKCVIKTVLTWIACIHFTNCGFFYTFPIESIDIYTLVLINDIPSKWVSRYFILFLSSLEPYFLFKLLLYQWSFCVGWESKNRISFLLIKDFVSVKKNYIYFICRNFLLIWSKK